MKSQSDKDKLVKYATEIGHRIFNIKSAYIVSREIGLHTNSRVSQESAKKYLEIINQHKGFFVPIIISLECYIITEMNSLLTMSKEKSIPDFARGLKILGLDFTQDIKQFHSIHGDAITKIQIARKKLTAHKDKKVEARSLEIPNIKQYDELFVGMEKLFNKMASKALGHSFAFFDDGSTEALNDTYLLMDNLMRGESQRISEIEVEYFRDVFKAGRTGWYQT